MHVLIAGGGLSGLALAQGLIKDGHTCQVFERDADDTRKIGAYEQGMRDYVYPFMRMTMDHDRQFGGGALEGRGSR